MDKLPQGEIKYEGKIAKWEDSSTEEKSIGKIYK